MFILPKLPYDYDALEPVISSDTLQLHHDKHHRTYVEKTNELAAKAGLDGRTLEDLVREAQRSGERKLFNNAAQAWNHAFFWDCMAPRAGGPGGPSGDIAAAIDRAFGGFDAFRRAFVDEGANHFASGWVWLVAGSDGLKVISTHDGDNALSKDGVFPLLVCDLWEHAYYLDYQNDRKGFLQRWIAEVANWSFAGRQLAAASGAGEGFRYPAPGAAQEPGEDRSPGGLTDRPPA
jgi:Fe-Mn family superoxide dismutase